MRLAQALIIVLLVTLPFGIGCAHSPCRVFTAEGKPTGRSGGLYMTRCDQMKKGELYGCDHCGFEFQVTKESRHHEGEAQGACALDMTCCGEPLDLKGHGENYPIAGGQDTVAQPVFGG